MREGQIRRLKRGGMGMLSPLPSYFLLSFLFPSLFLSLLSVPLLPTFSFSCLIYLSAPQLLLRGKEYT